MYYNTYDLASRIMDAVKERGFWPEEGGAAPIDYALPSYSSLPLDEATERWIEGEVAYGGEGIYLDLYYCSRLGPEGVRRDSILTVKTLADDEAAFLALAVLNAHIAEIGKEVLVQYEKELLELPEAKYYVLTLPQGHACKYKQAAYMLKQYGKHLIAEYDAAVTVGNIPWYGAERTVNALAMLLNGTHRHYLTQSDMVVFCTEGEKPKVFYVEGRTLEDAPMVSGRILEGIPVPHSSFLCGRDGAVYFPEKEEWEWLTEITLDSEYFAVECRDGEYIGRHLRDTQIRCLNIEGFEECHKARIALHEEMRVMEQLTHHKERGTQFYEVTASDLERIAELRNREKWES